MLNNRFGSGLGSETCITSLMIDIYSFLCHPLVIVGEYVNCSDSPVIAACTTAMRNSRSEHCRGLCGGWLVDVVLMHA